MFFTPELLEKRDSGFGLLWLAATLGSRSAFKKLPKRSVLTADISQLCDQISEPAEPLALRLSSNLMFGVVRVYKVKQEILMTDVTNCVTSLKKVVQDLRTTGALDAQLQMPNPVARASALTIVPDPRTALSLDYDAFVADWDEYLLGGDITLANSSTMDDDEEFDPTQKKKKSKTVQKDVAEPETVRKELHTLEEHHEHLLSASFDLSFHASANGGGAGDPSSSQVDGAFGDFFPFSDGLDVGDGLGLGDDLARELGWAVSPVKSVQASDRNGRNSDLNFGEINKFNNMADMDFNFNVDDMGMMVDDAPLIPNGSVGGTPGPQQRSKAAKTPRKENRMGPPTSRAGSVFSRVHVQASPATSFSRQLLSQDGELFQPLRDITAEHRTKDNQAVASKKLKRTRLLLDARTELTDDELKIARAKYLESQKLQRREIMYKKVERDSGRIIEEMIWGVPKGIQAEGLVNFWQENFRVQVEARSGALRIHDEDEAPRAKRRKTTQSAPQDEPEVIDDQVYPDNNMDLGMDWGFDNNGDMAMAVDDNGGFRHSSEEPGQARRLSRSASITGANLGFDLGNKKQGSGSQRSSLFPWDNAGPSSSSGNVAFGTGSDHAIEPVDVRLRSNSLSHREGSLAPSQRGSMIAGATFSPTPIGRQSQIFGEDFAFDVGNAAIPEETQQDTQKSELNLATLERNSANFLEYAKMQHQTLPRAEDPLSFEMVVPKATSTRHVAASAFYHCLEPRIVVQCLQRGTTYDWTNRTPTILL